MPGADNTPEMRARLRPSPRHDRTRRKLHDFGNRLADLVGAAQVGDARLAGFYSGELTRMYCEAVEGKDDGDRHQDEPQRAAA